MHFGEQDTNASYPRLSDKPHLGTDYSTPLKEESDSPRLMFYAVQAAVMVRHEIKSAP